MHNAQSGMSGWVASPQLDVSSYFKNACCWANRYKQVATAFAQLSTEQTPKKTFVLTVDWQVLLGSHDRASLYM